MSKNMTQPVPISERRSSLTMGLLWITMVTSFPAVLAGFEWYKQGISITQLIICASFSLLLLLLYSVPACEMGARSGLGYCALGRIVFGSLGGAFITTNLVWLFLAWYGFTAVLMAQAVKDLFHCPLPIVWLSIICAFLMSINNVFGFKGIANFARFMAAPILIVWVGYVFLKASTSSIAVAAAEVAHPSDMYALSLTSSFIVGFAVWGNEQDYWRYAKPGVWRSAIPLMVSITIGQIIFPLAGWLIARTNGIADNTTAITFMSNYCFGSMALIGLLVLMADYFSTNDSSLFGCAAAVEHMWPFKHNISVAIFAVIGALVAAILSVTNLSAALSALVSLNCIILPTPTIIMIMEWYLRERIFKSSMNFVQEAESPHSPLIRWSAFIALICGLTVGIATSGLIPALEPLHFGICSLQAWLTSILVYIPLRLYAQYKGNYAATSVRTEG